MTKNFLIDQYLTTWYHEVSNLLFCANLFGGSLLSDELSHAAKPLPLDSNMLRGAP